MKVDNRVRNSVIVLLLVVPFGIPILIIILLIYNKKLITNQKLLLKYVKIQYTKSRKRFKRSGESTKKSSL